MKKYVSGFGVFVSTVGLATPFTASADDHLVNENLDICNNISIKELLKEEYKNLYENLNRYIRFICSAPCRTNLTSSHVTYSDGVISFKNDGMYGDISACCFNAIKRDAVEEPLSGCVEVAKRIEKILNSSRLCSRDLKIVARMAKHCADEFKKNLLKEFPFLARPVREWPSREEKFTNILRKCSSEVSGIENVRRVLDPDYILNCSDENQGCSNSDAEFNFYMF